jgi:predicted alpha/beta hydrolase family esterase
MAPPFLILHGYAGSGPGHWQTWLAGRLRSHGRRVAYPDLPAADEPRLEAWLDTLGDELRALPDDPVVVCHSLACILWLHHCAAPPTDVGPAARVLLVAPVSASGGVPGVEPFFPAPLDAAAVARAAGETRVVAARDPYCPEGAERLYAQPLGLPFDRLPDAAGHIYPETGYGPWPSVERWCLDGGAVGP